MAAGEKKQSLPELASSQRLEEVKYRPSFLWSEPERCSHHCRTQLIPPDPPWLVGQQHLEWIRKKIKAQTLKRKIQTSI